MSGKNFLSLVPIGIASVVLRKACPSCAGTFRHRRECELKVLSMEEATTLGLEDARKLAAKRQKE